MMVLVITPIASLTVPVAVMIMMPVTIIPVGIPMISVSRRDGRGADQGSRHGKSYQYPFIPVLTRESHSAFERIFYLRRR